MMMVANRMARLVWRSSSRVTNTSIAQTTVIDRTKMISWPNRTLPSASARTAAPKASPPPRMRQSIGRRSALST